MDELLKELQKMVDTAYFIYGYVPKAEIVELIKKYEKGEK